MGTEETIAAWKITLKPRYSETAYVARSFRRSAACLQRFKGRQKQRIVEEGGDKNDGLWLASDSKIAAPGSRVLALANDRDETIIKAKLDLSPASRKYARDALQEPAFLRIHWKTMLAACRCQLRQPYTKLS